MGENSNKEIIKISCHDRGARTSFREVEGRSLPLWVGNRWVKFFIHEHGEIFRLTHYRTGLRVNELYFDDNEAAQEQIYKIIDRLGLGEVLARMENEQTLNEDYHHDPYGSSPDLEAV